MNGPGILPILLIIYSNFGIILSIDHDNKNVTRETSFSKYISNFTLRPLNIFSSVDFILDKDCKINPEKYFKSPNIILNCKLKKAEHVSITFNRRDKRINIYQNDNNIRKIYIKLGENAKVDLCIEKSNVKNDITKSCRKIVFWVINEYETFHKNFIGYDKVNFNDDHFLNFIEGLSETDGDVVPFNDINNESIHCVILEKNTDDKINKLLLSPIDGVINMNIEFGSKLILHLPQYQHECGKILEEINKNYKNPSIIYFVDSKRLGFGPLSIDISSPEISNLAKDVKGKIPSYLETTRSFFLSTLNKNTNKRGFVLFVFNYTESKVLANDCLELIVDEKVAKGIVTGQKDFNLSKNIFKCFYNDKCADNNVENVSFDISNPDGLLEYDMKLIDTNNTFLYINDKLQEDGVYQHNIFLIPNQKELVEYVVKDRDDMVISRVNLSFSRKQAESYIDFLAVLVKYLAFPAILVDLKGVIDLWLITKLITSSPDIFDSILGTPNEFSFISGENNIRKNNWIVERFSSLIKIDKNESIGEAKINHIYYSMYALFSSIIINVITLLLMFMLKSKKKNKRNDNCYYTKITQVLVSIIPHTLIFTLSKSLNIMFMDKFDILINGLLVSNNILKLTAVSSIIISLLIYKMTSNYNRNAKGIFTYTPWKDCNYVLNFPGFPYFQAIKWPLPVIGETHLIKLWAGKKYFLIEYKLDFSNDKGIDKDFYRLSIISATFNEVNDSNNSAKNDEEDTSILYTPAAWIKTNISGTKSNHKKKLITNVNLSDICILSLRGCNDNFYIHNSQTMSNKSDYSILYIFISVFLLSYSNLPHYVYLNNYKIIIYIIFSIMLKLDDYRESKFHKFQNEWFKSNVYRSKLVDVSSNGILIGLCILKIMMHANGHLNVILNRWIVILSLFIMFCSIIPSIIMVCIWTANILKYYHKMCNNTLNLLYSYVKMNLFLQKQAQSSCNDDYFQSANTNQFAYYIENKKSKSSLIPNAIFNAAKPVVELNVLKFTFLYNNIPISPTCCYIPVRQYKKLLYYFGELNELPRGIDTINKSNLTICSGDSFNVNADMKNFFATIEISRPLQISKSLPNIHNNCLSLNINPPKSPYKEWNKLYDVVYDDKNHTLIITGPFIIPCGSFIVRASIKNGCRSESDSNILTSIIADNCKCNYHGILNVAINPDYIENLNIYKKIHICMYSSGKSISFTINPKSIYVEVNTISNYMILRSQNFVQGNVYKVQYKCLPYKTDTGFLENVTADNNISRIKIPIPNPKENFNYKLYEYHVTNFSDITCSITPIDDNWGFEDEFVSKIITSYPKIWGLSNVLDYKIPCSINRRLENDFYRITPKYNIAATIAEAQKECLMAIYSTLILNRINSLEFVGFYFYDKQEINDFFSKFGIILQLDDTWINPISDSAIRTYGYETMQKAYNALYLDLKSKLEFYINLSEQIVSHLWDMNSLYNEEIILQAIDGFDNLTLNNNCVDSALELTTKRVSRDIPQSSIKKLLFPPVISGKNIKWNLHLSNQLDKWRGEIKSFFDIKIGVLNSFSMLTSSYAIPLDFTLSCLGNSLRKLSNELNLPYILYGSNDGYKLTHIVITEKSLISAKNDWNLLSNHLHSTSFNAFMGYVKITYPYDSVDVWHPTFLNWRPHGIIFDVINMDQIYVKFTDVLAIEINSDSDNSRNEASILNGLLDSEKMNILSLTCKNNSFKTMNIESSNANDHIIQGIVHKKFDNYKLYFKTTCSNNSCMELILDEYTTISKVESDNITIMEFEEKNNSLNNINKDELESISESHHESITEIVDEVGIIEDELRQDKNIFEIPV